MNACYDTARRLALAPEFCAEFPGWIADHWNVYAEFERLARDGIERGHKRLSAKFIFELIRWRTAVREAGEIYKLNNSMAASCARLFDRMNPAMAGHFEFRNRAVCSVEGC